MADIDQIAFVLLPVSVLGSVLNWTIFYSIHKLPSFNHSFGLLSANQALSDALHSTVFLFYFCPMVLLDVKSLKFYSHICGFVLLLLYELSVMTHFSISLNRVFSVWKPLSYEKVFTFTRTKFLIAVLWFYTTVSSLILYLKLCHFYFDEATHFLTFTNSELCGAVGWYGDFLKNTFIVAVIACLDMFTLIGVRKVTRSVATGLSDVSLQTLSRRDRRFLKQTIIQDSVFLLELATYFVIPQYFQNRWIVFLGTSFAWVAIHVADGIIVIVCNPEIREFIFGLTGESHAAVTAVRVSSIF